MRKMASRSPNFPDSLIRLFPNVFEVLHQFGEKTPGLGRGLSATATAHIEGTQDLSVNIQLELAVSRIPNPHRTTVLVTRQPWKFELSQAPFPSNSVYDLQVLW